MASAHAGRLALVMSGLLVLAACEPGQEFDLFGAGQNSSSTGGIASAGSTGKVGQDIESPEVFQRTDSGLWDGRPSLGGVWVAHPDVVEPERVLIRNQDNGSSIIGALFRRERENPGPRFQVSSDAAAELGMLAGAPSALSVVALRQVEAPVVVEPAPVMVEPAPVVATAPVAVPDAAATVAAEAVAAIGLPDTIEAPAIVPEVPIASMAASAIEAATANNPTASLPEPSTAAESALAATASVTPDPVPAPSTVPLSALAKPFLQIGIFSVESNAEDTSKLLRSSGIIPTTETSQSNGKTSWRVLVGPIGNSSDRTALLTKIKSLGFTDAYAVSN